MTTQYTTILKLALPVQGELSGTWGDVVNNNITQMVEQAVAGKAVVNTWTGNSHTLTTADGTTSESRCAILELTDSGTALTGAGTVVCPTNTKLYIVDNNTAEIITVQTAAGTGVAVPVGKTMLVYCDGTNVVEGVTHANSLSLGTSTVTADKILDEDNMASDSATAIATQQSIKAYVDSQVGTVDTLSEILANGNTTGANDIDVDSAQKVQFRDADIYLNSSVDGQLDIVADTEIQIAATTVDLNGDLDVSGTALVAGVLTTTAATVFNGGFASNADSTLGTDKKVQFRDAAIYLNSSVDGQLDIVADGEVQIDTALVDINGNLDVSGTALVAGVLTTTAATVFNGGFASNADSTLGTDKKVQFRDADIYLNSSVDGQLDIVADGEVQIDTALVDINGNLDVSGTTNISGSVSFTKNAIAGVAISTTSRASNTVTVTTSAVHGLTSGDLVNVNGVADTSFNGYFTVSVSSTTVFTYSQTGADGSSTGGTSTEVVYNLNASGTALNWMNGPLNIAANSGIDGLEITQSGAGNGLHVTGTTGLVGNTTLTGNLDVSGTALVTGVLTTTAATVFNGGFASNADSTLGTDKKVQFRDSAIYINSSVDGQLDIVADTEIQIAATTVDLNGNLDVSGTALVTGVLTTTAATVFNGGFASNADSTLGTDKKVQFRDSAIYINSSVDGQLDLVADTEIQIAATTIDVNGTLAFDSLKGTGATTVTNILDEDNMASDSATAIATQQSIKAYVDSQVGSFDTLAEVLTNGNTTGSTDIAVDSAQKVQFRDAAIYINSSVDGQLDIVADTEIQIAATTVDLNGNLDVSGTALVTGVLTTTAATVFNGGFASNADGLIQANLGAKLEIKSTDNFIADGEVVGSLDFISADYNYPAQPIKGQIRTESVSSTGESALFFSTTQTTNLRDRIKIDYNGDVSFYEDTGSTAKLTWSASNESLTFGTNLAITTNEIDVATGDLTLDVAGDIILDADTGVWRFKDAGTTLYQIAVDGASVVLYTGVSDADMVFKGNDGGSTVTALTLDMSAAGAATFSGDATIGAATAATNVQLILNGVASKTQRIKFQESGVDRWLIGQGAASETSAFELYNAGGVIALSVDRTTNVATFASGAVFNAGSSDIDFRVESDTNANMLFVDAGVSAVGIGTATQYDGTALVSPLTISSLSGGSVLETFRGSASLFQLTMSTTGISSWNTSGSAAAHSFRTGTTVGTTSIKMYLGATGGLTMTPEAGGHTIFNEDGVDADFRVESDNNASMLTVDASADLVTISGGSKVTDEVLRVNGAQVVGSDAAGVYTVGLNEIFAASAAKYLRIQQDGSLFGGLTITATGDYSNVNAIGCFQKIYSIGANNSNTTLFSPGNVTVADLGETSGQFSMGTPTKPNATTIYIPLENLNASYILDMSITVEFRGRIGGINSVDILDQ
jgi:hypothetical protein